MNDKRTVQIKGKMLIASSRIIVGAMKIHAMARSDRPRMRRATGAGVACAARAASDGGVFFMVVSRGRSAIGLGGGRVSMPT